MRSEFYLSNPEITTDKQKNADIVWVIAPWLANKLKPKKFKKLKKSARAAPRKTERLSLSQRVISGPASLNTPWSINRLFRAMFK